MHHRTFAALIGATLLLACGQDEPPEAPRDAALDSLAVGQAAGLATATVFVDRADPDARLVFVGSDSSVVAGQAASAVFVPLSTFSVERDGIPNEFPPADSMARMLEAAGVGDGEIVVVGEPIPAGRAFAALDYLGLGDRAALLDGGLAAVPTDTAGRGAPAPDEGPLEVEPREDMIVDAAWVSERLEDPGVAILDARPPEEFSGDTPGDGVDRPGHIPGARNVFWQTLVRSESDSRLKEESELRRIFEEAGVGAGDTVVAYCRTGGQGSFLYAVARHLGYDVRLYDGSYVDWSRTDYPVER